MTHFGGLGTRDTSEEFRIRAILSNQLAAQDETLESFGLGGSTVTTGDGREPLTPEQQTQLVSGTLGDAGPTDLSGRFVRNVSAVDVWTFAHIGVGAAMALSGFGALALLMIAIGTEAAELVLKKQGTIQEETAVNVLTDVLATSLGFVGARALV